MSVSVFTPGTSNFRSSSVKESLVSIRVGFRAPNGSLVNVTNPVGRITHEERLVPALDMVIGSVVEGGYFSLAQISTGVYGLAFIPRGMTYGLYKLECSGQYSYLGKNHVLFCEGSILVGEISMVQFYVNQLRIRLMDDMLAWYRLDEPIHQWPLDTLYTCLSNSLSHINSKGPRITTMGYESVPEDLLITGGIIYALETRARLEIANSMNYTDGHSINIDRGPKYQSLAQQMRASWEEMIISWKKATPPTPIALKSQRLPFRIFRMVGMLPNYQSYFEGVTGG